MLPHPLLPRLTRIMRRSILLPLLLSLRRTTITTPATIHALQPPRRRRFTTRRDLHFPVFDVRPGGVGVGGAFDRGGGEVVRDDAAAFVCVFPGACGGVDGLVVLRPAELSIGGDFG